MIEAALSRYLLAAIIAWSPPETHDFTGAPRQVTLARYAAIAADFAGIALDPREAPLFAGPNGHAQTALLALAIARWESGGFRAEVDSPRASGDCRAARCAAVCLMQVHVPYATSVVDRRSCIRAGLAA